MTSFPPTKPAAARSSTESWESERQSHSQHPLPPKAPFPLAGEGKGGVPPLTVPSRPQLRSAAAVAAALLLALAVRLWALPGTGLVYYDEGSGTLNGLITLAHRGLPQVSSDWTETHDLVLAALVSAGVPLDRLVWGSAIDGLVMVVLLAWLAWRLWGPPAAAVAGVFAATLPLGVIYSHRAIAEADAMMLLSLGLLAWERWTRSPASRPRAAAAFLVLLLGFTVHYRYIAFGLPLVALIGWWQAALLAAYGGIDLVRYRLALGVLVLAGLLFALRSRLPQPAISRPAAVFLICLAPGLAAVAAEILVAVMRAAAPGLIQRLGLPGQLSQNLLGGSGPLSDLEYYPRTLWDYGGPAFIAALVLGAWVLLRRRRSLTAFEAALLGLTAGSLILFSALPYKVPRTLAFLAPLGALVAAQAPAVAASPSWRWAVAVVLCASCLLDGALLSGPARDPSGTDVAGRWLAAQPGTIAGDRWPIWSLWAGRDRVVPGQNYRTVADLRAAGVRWAVVDGLTWAGYPEPSATKQVVTCGQPVMEFADPAGWSPQFFLEEPGVTHIGYAQTLQLRRQVLDSLGGRETIRVYDLQGPGTASC